MPPAKRRFIIDGNNLLYALADELVNAGRSQLAEMLEKYERLTGFECCVVFDGFAARGAETQRILDIFPHIEFAGDVPADDVIIDMLKSYSAPRTLTVVSSDRQLKKAAAARKASNMTSQAFARGLLKTFEDETKAPPPPPEPPEKRRGLADGQLDEWLDEFGF